VQERRERVCDKLGFAASLNGWLLGQAADFGPQPFNFKTRLLKIFGPPVLPFFDKHRADGLVAAVSTVKACATRLPTATMESWKTGQEAMNKHLRREITPWEPQRIALENSSTYSAHFKSWPIVANPPKRPVDERPMQDFPFDTRSTMQDSFQNWRGDLRSKPCKPSQAYEPTAWMAPISTTHRDAFQKWPSVRQQNFKPAPKPLEGSDTETGRSTMQDSYQPIRHFRPTQSCAPAEKPIEWTPFDGTTTSRAAFLPWPVQARMVHKRAEPQHTFSGSDGTFPSSTYRDMFRELKVPKSNNHALGIQVVGGKFYTMMPRGTAPPATKKVMMTTTQDNQGSVDIVCVLSDDERKTKGKVLGEFTLDGIVPSRKGVPQIEITYNLDTQNMLRVTANDLQGNRTRALTVQEKVRLG
jgi:hypothetical protein